MDDTTAPVGGTDAIAPAPTITPADTGSPVGVSEAARQLSNWRKEKNAPPKEIPAAPEKDAPQQLAPEPTSDPETAPAEQTEAPEPAEDLPPIDAPRSWTAEEKERFKTFPRELQAYLSEREQERDRDLRRRQNEAADRQKALEADMAKAKQAQQQYESALPTLLMQMQAAGGEFADVRTMADVTKMAAEDPNRYLRWDAHNKQVQAVQQQINDAQQRQQQEQGQAWSKFADEQDKLFAERVPGVDQKTKDAAVSVLKDAGFSEDELSRSWNGQMGISLRDHRFQSLIVDAVKYRQLKSAPPKPTPKPVPAVQRPGTAPNKGAQLTAQITEQVNRLNNTRGVEAAREAAKLLKLQRQTAR